MIHRRVRSCRRLPTSGSIGPGTCFSCMRLLPRGAWCSGANCGADRCSNFRLIPPACVKPFVRRQNNEAAEAPCKAAQRPNMRCLPVNSEAKQGVAAAFGMRKLIRPRTQRINASRRRQASGVTRPSDRVRGGRAPLLRSRQTTTLCRRRRGRRCRSGGRIASPGRTDQQARRGDPASGAGGRGGAAADDDLRVGPRVAAAPATRAPPPEHFRRARDFTAWLGRTPRQPSIGVRQRLGATTGMGARSLGRLSILGADSVRPRRGLSQQSRSGLGRTRVQQSALKRTAPIRTGSWTTARRGMRYGQKLVMLDRVAGGW